MSYDQFLKLVQAEAFHQKRLVKISEAKQSIVDNTIYYLNQLPCTYCIISAPNAKSIPETDEEWATEDEATKKIKDRLSLYYEKFMKAE